MFLIYKCFHIQCKNLCECKDLFSVKKASDFSSGTHCKLIAIIHCSIYEFELLAKDYLLFG